MKTYNKLILFFTIFITSILLSCSDPVEDSNRDLAIDLMSDDGSNALTVPNQTTGTYLTMNCIWLKREGFSENVIGCRFDSDAGTKAEAKDIDVKAYQGDTELAATVEDAPATDYWNKIITIPGDKISGVDIASFQYGKELVRQSVERLLLHNKGIKSVRRVDNVVSVAGFDIPMPKSVILPETYCDKNGNNKIAPTNDPVNFPSYYNLPDHMTTYYWEPTEVVKNAAESIGLGFISSSILGDGIDLVCDGLRDSGVEVLEYLGSKCLKKPEAIEEEPILHRNGFCLRKVSYENENNYCTIAVFENPSRNTDQYFMAFGKERYADISRDLKELGVEDSVQIYLDTFEKCK